MEEKSLKVKDLVNIGVFSAIYMILSFIVMVPSMASPVIWLLWPAICGVVCGSIYMLLAAKVPKKGDCTSGCSDHWYHLFCHR